ncbi:MAG: esterase family protein [Chloroflexi bacterium]|nr:esterase family protein [Chloroflexota bacterium]
MYATSLVFAIWRTFRCRPMQLGVIILVIITGIVACEPLAPEPDSQVVVVITNTPTLVDTPTPTPLLPTALPTRILPTEAPTVMLSPTATVPPCNETEGRLIDGTIESAITEEPVPYRLYLPPCFFVSGRRYPYTILLHGSSYDYTQWTEELGVATFMDDVLAEKGDIAPMVLVMPEGGVPQELNAFDSGQSFEDVILNELIPQLEAEFCLWAAPEGRAIGGISRGGFWAFSIALRHPEQFAAVGGHSPFFVEDNAPAAYNPLNLANTLLPTTPLRIYLDHARGDAGEPGASALSTTLRNRNIVHIYDVNVTGGHNNDYWSSQLRDYLEFYSASWPKDIAALPTCF